ncbi:MAG TPA: glycosyltransferase family 39 protein [Thermoanaerobaculia bacterium]
MNARAACVLITLVAVAAVAHGWTIFNQTVDEPAHIAGGVAWLQHRYAEADLQHPPLARIACGLGPLLRGARFVPHGHWLFDGNAILYGNGDYLATLTSARAGTLLFFLLGCFVVAAWAARLGGAWAGAAALLFFALQPTVIAHAGVATNDMAAAACIAAALFLLTSCIERPSLGRGVLLGVAAAAAVTSKFSALAFLPAAALVIAIAARKSLRRTLAGPLIASFITLIVVVVTIYQFDIGLLLRGIAELRAHNAAGHPGYLFGYVRRDGWWYYFPVALWFKSTPALLVAFALGARRMLAPAFAAAAMLLVAMTSHIDIGVRHVLPLYPLLAVVAGVAVVQWRHVASAVLVLAQLAGFPRAHPDHLAYFNVTAGRDPAHILLDSNLDWGQDLLRLRRICDERHIDALSLAYFGSAQPGAHGFRGLRPLLPYRPATGWIAISEMHFREASGRTRGAWAWLGERQPVAYAGKSIRIYYVNGPGSAAPR